MKLSLFQAFVLMTIWGTGGPLAAHPSEVFGVDGLGVNGSIVGTCLSASEETLKIEREPLLSLELVTVIQSSTSAEPGERRLVARLKITSATRAPEHFQINPNYQALKDLSLEKFHSFCGQSFVSGQVLGGLVEISWALRPDTQIEDGTRLAQWTGELSRSDDSAVLTFAGVVATTLKKYEGHFVRERSVNVVPAELVDSARCVGLVGCFTTALKNAKTFKPSPIDIQISSYDSERVKNLQAQLHAR